jgi:hypothetical protein
MMMMIIIIIRLGMENFTIFFKKDFLIRLKNKF